jgi:N-acetyl sugar amidotransferase
MFPNLKYCTRCIMPETREGIQFDEMGQCQACVSSEQKIHIDWTVRRQALDEIVQQAKSNAGDNYDCILPISGGKDSTWQMHVIVKELGMKPLCVTHNHNWYSKTGWYNLQNSLEKLNIDHIMFTPNRSLVNRCALHSVETIGDACWHCHMGVSAFTLKMAVAYKIPLIIWGESTAEHGRATYDQPDKFDRDYFLRVSAKLTPEQFACDYITLRDLFPYQTPSLEECEAIGLQGIHLGDYIYWDAERQTEFIKQEYGWRGLEIEGAYKDYKSAECSMAGIHDFLCFLKRGYGRATIQASDDIRAGLMTREEGFEIIQKYERIEPKSLEYFMQITGLDKQDIDRLIKNFQPEQVKGTSFFMSKEWRNIPEAGKPFVQRLIDGEE